MMLRGRCAAGVLMLVFAHSAAGGGSFGSSFGAVDEAATKQFDGPLTFNRNSTIRSEYSLWESGRDDDPRYSGNNPDRSPAALLGFTAGSRNIAVHFSSAYDVDERQFGLGFSSAASTLSVIAGDGDSGTGLFRLYRGVDPNLFHGGGQERFSYRGAVFSRAFSDAASGLLGTVELRSPGLEDREAWVAGFNRGQTYVNVTTIRRGAAHVADTFGLGYGGRRLGFDYQYLGGASGVEAHRLGLNLFGDRSGNLRVELQSARNPLYAVKDENRILFSFSATWGGAPAMRLDGEGDAEEAPAAGHSRMRTAAIIAGGVVAAAALASSGSSSKDKASRFDGQHQAAFEVVNSVNPRSVRENREYGGWVYRNGDGSYAYTAPVGGAEDSVNIGAPNRVVPQGTTATASYHTHAAFDPRYDNENFSRTDFEHDRYWKVDGYLGTPAGRFLYHDRRQRVSRLGTVAN